MMPPVTDIARATFPSWACTSHIVTVTKTDNGASQQVSISTAAARPLTTPEPGMGGSLAARPLQPSHHWTRSPNHPITKSLVSILAMGSTQSSRQPFQWVPPNWPTPRPQRLHVYEVAQSRFDDHLLAS